MRLAELIIIRGCLPADKGAVMDLIRPNIPDFFAAEKEPDLSKYLEKGIEFYYVLLVDEQIVGCGGIDFAENGTIGEISWDIIHPAFQGKKLGTKLLKRRISVLKTIDNIQKITVRTSQLTYRLYKKRGFILNEIKKDYWPEGSDMYGMEFKGRFKQWIFGLFSI